MARVIVDLTFVPAAHLFMKREPFIQTACLILSRANGYGKVCAVSAIVALSQIKGFRVQMVEKNCITAMVATAINGRINAKGVLSSMCRCLYNLSHTYMSRQLVLKDHCLLLLHLMYRDASCSSGDVQLMAAVLENLTLAQPSPEALAQVCGAIMNQDGFRLLRELITKFSAQATAICQSSIVVLRNMALVTELHEALVGEGFMEMLTTIASSSASHISAEGGDNLKPEDVLGIVSAIDLVSGTEACRKPLVDGGAVKVFEDLISFLDDRAQQNMATSIAALASSPQCRESLVQQGALRLILTLSTTKNKATQAKCALAMGLLSDISFIESGTVQTLNILATAIDTTTSTLLSPDKSVQGKSADGAPVSPLTPSAGEKAASPPVAKPKLSGKLKLQGALKNAMQKEFAMDMSPAPIDTAPPRTPDNKPKEEEGGSTPVLRSLEKDEMDETRYRVIHHTIDAEGDGMAKKMRVKLPLPQMDSNRSLDPPDRTNDLLALPVDAKPLAKDTSEPSIIQATVAPLLAEAEEATIASAPEGSVRTASPDPLETEVRATSSKRGRRSAKKSGSGSSIGSRKLSQ